MAEFFAEYKTIIVFLHVISAVVWVGGMIAMRFAAHYSFMEIESPGKRLERIAHALKNLFAIVLPFVFMLLITAVLMIKGYALSQSTLGTFAHAKEAIWVVMALNLFAMMYRRSKAQKAIENGEFVVAKDQLGLIGKVMVPVNITLGVVAIFLGTYLSNTL
jgi:uncharacterized membrane protein